MFSTIDGGTGNIQSTPTFPTAAVPTAQAITVLASQIPSFMDPKKKIESWIYRIELIANAHEVTT